MADAEKLEVCQVECYEDAVSNGTSQWEDSYELLLCGAECAEDAKRGVEREVSSD